MGKVWVMTLEQVGLLLSLLIGGGGLAVGIGALVYAKRAASISQEELGLAREQAAMRPVIEVESVRLLDVGDVEDLAEHVELIEEARAEREEERRREEARKRKEEKEREEAKKRKEEERRLLETSPDLRRTLSDIARYRPPMMDLSHIVGVQPRVPDHLLDESDPYEGPMPDKVLKVVLINSGRTAAYEVAGWLTFDPRHVEPLDHFCDGLADVRASKDEPFRVQLGGREDDNLLPTSNDFLVYEVALKVRSTDATSVGYEFVSRAGKDSEGSWELKIPDQDPGTAGSVP